MNTHSDSPSTFCPEQPWFVMNASNKYSLLMSDNPMISHFYNFSAEVPSSSVLAIPDGCVDIIFDCDSTYPLARVCGSPVEAREFNIIDKHQYFGVRFSPGIVPKFNGISAIELAGQEVNAFELFPNANELSERISQHHSISTRAELFNKLFTSHHQTHASDLTKKIISALRSHNGYRKINDLEELMGCSNRTIQRRFFNETGMTPKTFSRIVRCHSALTSLCESESYSFLNISMELGFSDQPHFHREFRSLIGVTPLDFVKNKASRNYQSRLSFTEPNSSPALFW